MEFDPEPGQSISDVLDAANDDRRAGRYADSLDKYEWFFEHSRNEPGMGGVRLSFALRYWLDLAADYPPAMKAFVALRDRTGAHCRKSGGEFNAFHELSALNGYLDNHDRTVHLFLDIAKEDKSAAATIYPVAEHLLVAKGLFEECGRFLDVEHTIETNIEALRIGKEVEDTFEEQEHSPPLFAEEMFREEMTRLVALLAMNHRTAEAQMAMNRALEELGSDEFRSDLEAALKGQLPGN